MNIEITEKRENPLLDRTELKLRIQHENAPTPSRMEVKKHLATLLGASDELIVIEKLTGLPRKGETSGTACIYRSKEGMEALELKHLLTRGAPKEQKEKPAPAEKPEEAGESAKEGKGAKG